MTLTELVEEAHGLAKEKGWYDGGPRNVPEQLMLVVSELSEALEAYRVGDMDFRLADNGKPEGFGVELADAVIRIADMCGAMGVDLEMMVQSKHGHNRTRPHRHGGKKA